MIVGVRFSPSGRVHFYDDNGIRVEFADRVMVETEGRGYRGQYRHRIEPSRSFGHCGGVAARTAAHRASAGDTLTERAGMTEL